MRSNSRKKKYEKQSERSLIFLLETYYQLRSNMQYLILLPVPPCFAVPTTHINLTVFIFILQYILEKTKTSIIEYISSFFLNDFGGGRVRFGGTYYIHTYQISSHIKDMSVSTYIYAPHSPSKNKPIVLHPWKLAQPPLISYTVNIFNL